jgi:sugar lactone lactonase YvrE
MSSKRAFLPVFCFATTALALGLAAGAVPAAAETIYANDFSAVRAYDTELRAPAVTRIIGDVVLENSGAVAIGPDGNLYVLDRGDSFDKMDILRFTADGSPIDTFASATGLVAPEVMKFGPDGDLYVVDGGATPPAVYSFDGVTGAANGAFTTGKDLAALAFGLAFDATGRLYVSDPFSGSSAIHRFNADGSFDTTVLVDKDTKASDLIDFPRGICMGPEGKLYIVDYFAETVFRYDPAGDSVEIYAVVENDPQDCAFGADGSLYVDVFAPSGIAAINRDNSGNAVTPVQRFATDLPGHRTLAVGSATLTPATTSTSVTTSSTGSTSTSSSSSSTSTLADTTTTTVDPAGTLCGDFDGNGAIRASDALAILRAAVGLIEICPLTVCDTDGNGRLAASDALRALQKAVGLAVAMLCPAEA